MTEPLILARKYQLVRCLGEGSAGAVWEAEHVAVGKRVAIKLMHAHLARHPDMRARFLAEARAAARIAHPNVVDVFDVDDAEDGTPFLVMELLRGETLEQIVHARGALAVSYAVTLMLQVLSALDAAHARGIVHRDLKPANICVVHPRPDRPVAKVLDFGIAKGILGDATAPDETGLIFGTPEYMAPEQATGGAVDARADLYAAAAILYELLAGRPPFVGDTPTGVLAQVLSATPEPLSSRVPGLPEPIDALVAAALAKDADDRPASAREMVGVLAGFVPRALVPSLLPTRASEQPLLLHRAVSPSGDRPAPSSRDGAPSKRTLELLTQSSFPPEAPHVETAAEPAAPGGRRPPGGERA